VKKNLHRHQKTMRSSRISKITYFSGKGAHQLIAQKIFNARISVDMWFSRDKGPLDQYHPAAALCALIIRKQLAYYYTLRRESRRRTCRLDILNLNRGAENMEKFPKVKTGENVSRQVLANHPDLMVVAFNFDKKGAEGSLHDHPHVQSTYVERGRFRFTLGDDSFDVAQGDSFVVPSGMTHGCVCLEPGRLIDCFTPRREDFL